MAWLGAVGAQALADVFNAHEGLIVRQGAYQLAGSTR